MYLEAQTLFVLTQILEAINTLTQVNSSEIHKQMQIASISYVSGTK